MSAGLDTLFCLFLFAVLLVLVRHALPEGSDRARADPNPDGAETIKRQARPACGQRVLVSEDLDR